MLQVRYLLLAGLLLISGCLQAQTFRTIEEIRQVVDPLVNDQSVLNGDTVVVEGVVVTDPRDWYQAIEATRNYSFWIQEAGASGPNHGLQIRLGNASAAGVEEATRILDVRIGMRVQLTGVVANFRGEIQINLANDRSIQILDSNIPLVERPIFDDLSAFTNLLGEAQLPTSTEWEGTYLTVRNLEVISVNTNATRGNFSVQDELGNTIVIWDAHKDMRRNQNGWQKPTAGDKYLSISGILYHRIGGTPLQFPGTYELHPYSPADLVKEVQPVNFTIAVSSNVVCSGGMAELAVLLDTGDPLPPGVSVSWEPANLVENPSAPITRTRNLTQTTTFTATIRNGADEVREAVEISVVPNRLRLSVFEQPGAINGRKQLVLVVAGGQRPYEYSANGGTDFRSTSRFLGLSTGTIPLVVRDANGCILEQDYILR